MGAEELQINGGLTENEIKEIHTHANIGDDYCEYMFYRFKECDPKDRARLFAYFLYLYKSVWPDRIITYPKGSYVSHPDEYEAELENEIFEHLDALIFRNLPESEFYNELDKYVFDICQENEKESFWRFYSCITNSCLPYYQIDFSGSTILTPEEYNESIVKIDKELLGGMFGAIVSDKTRNNHLLIGYAVMHLLDRIDGHLEQVTALYHVIDAYYYMVTHIEETREYFLKDDQNLPITEKWTGQVITTYEPEDRHENIYIDEDFFYDTGKYFDAFIDRNGFDSYHRACRITQYINSGEYNTLGQVASILMRYISRFDEFTDRAIALGGAFYFFTNQLNWNEARLFYVKSETEGNYHFYSKDYSDETYPSMTEKELRDILHHAVRDRGYTEYMFYRFLYCENDVRKQLFDTFLKEYPGIKSDESVSYPVGRLYLRVKGYRDEYRDKFNEDIRQFIFKSPTIDDFFDALYNYIFEADDEERISFWKFYTCLNLTVD